MVKTLVCLFDKTAGMFFPPVAVPKLGVAFRNIQDEISRGGDNNPLAEHPGDFQLWTVGTFDDEDGDLVAMKELVCEVSSLIIDRGADGRN